VEAVDPIAIRATQRPAFVTIRRQAQTATPLAVRLEFGGDAKNGQDYQYLPAMVEFAAGQATRIVAVIPLASADAERSTVVVAVKPDPDALYDLGTPAACDVIIVATEALGALELSKALDGDGDGLTAAREAELGTDPDTPTLVLEQGWNLVSIPLLPEEGWTLARQLGQAGEHVLVVWRWDGEGYQPVDPQADVLIPGHGYFVYALESCASELPLSALGDGRRTLTPGWQLIGPIRGGQLSSEVAGLVLWGMEEGAYVAPAENWVQPMKGYWLFSLPTQDIVLP